MPHYRVFNAYPSFKSTFTTDADVTLPNPIPNYGMMADHLQDYFDNQMSETVVSGTDSLSVFLASNKSLTSIVAADLTAMASDASVDFGVTASTVGFGLLDFRGESWKYMIGDGIIGPSNTTNLSAYTETVDAAVGILNYFKSAYPSIKWAFAGLPHLPKYTCFAPTAGSSFSWGEGLTNTPGATNNFWDAQHPTGASGVSGSYDDRIFEWSHTPSDLKSFYRTKSISRSRSVLEASGWLCPDVNPVATSKTIFGKYVHTILPHHIYTSDLISISKEFSDSRLVDCKVMPIFNSLLRSRESHVYDDPYGEFLGYGIEPYDPNILIEYLAGFTGSSGQGMSGAADVDVDLGFIRAGILEPSVINGAVGFIYQDSIPLMVNFACTGATSPSAAESEAIARARNYISDKVYEGTDISLIPWTSVRNEVLSMLSYSVTAKQLRTISEAIPVGNAWSFTSASIQVPNGESVDIPEYKSILWKRCNAGICTDLGANTFQEYKESNPLIADCGDCPPPPPPETRGLCCLAQSGPGGLGLCSDSYEGSPPGSGISEAACAAIGGNFTPLGSAICGAGVPLTCANFRPGGPCAAQGFELGCWTDIDPCGDACGNIPCCLGEGLDPQIPCVWMKWCSYECRWCDSPAGMLDCQGNPGLGCPPTPQSIKQRTCRSYDIGPGACCCVDCSAYGGQNPARIPSRCSDGVDSLPGDPPMPGAPGGILGGIAGRIHCDKWDDINSPFFPPLDPNGNPCNDPNSPLGKYFFPNGCDKPCNDYASVETKLCNCCAVTNPDGFEDPASGDRCCNSNSGRPVACGPLNDCFQPCAADPNSTSSNGQYERIDSTFLLSLSEEMRKLVLEDLYNFNLVPLLDVETKLLVENIAKKNVLNLSTQRNRGMVMNTISAYKEVMNPTKNTILNLKYNYLPSNETANRIRSEFSFDRFLLPISYT